MLGPDLVVLANREDVAVRVFEPSDFIAAGGCPNSQLLVLNKRKLLGGDATTAEPSGGRFDVFDFPTQDGGLQRCKVRQFGDANFVFTRTDNQGKLIEADEFEAEFVMNMSALLKELILHACTFAKLHKKAANERRIVEILIDQLKAVESVPLQLPQPTDSRAKRVVETLFRDPSNDKTLEALCKDCGASERTIQRLFLDQTKITLAKWRQQLRLLHGLLLLTSGEKVSAAALEAGYNSTSAFISMFRKQLGTTPTRYLRNGVA
jgi:AraC-like DNA-binding protein